MLILSCRWTSQSDGNDTMEGTDMLIPKIPPGVSGTALAASLLRDGWSVSYMKVFILHLLAILQNS